MAARLSIFIKMAVKAFVFGREAEDSPHSQSQSLCAQLYDAYNVRSLQRGGYTAVWGRATRTAHAAAI